MTGHNRPGPSFAHPFSQAQKLRRLQAPNCPLRLFSRFDLIFLCAATPLPAAAGSWQWAGLRAHPRLTSERSAILQQRAQGNWQGWLGQGQEAGGRWPPALGPREPTPRAAEEGGGVQECSRPPPAGSQDPNWEGQIIPAQEDTRSRHARRWANRLQGAPLRLTAILGQTTDPLRPGKPRDRGGSDLPQGAKLQVAKPKTRGMQCPSLGH